MLRFIEGVEATRQSQAVQDKWRVSMPGRRSFDFELFFANENEKVLDLVTGWIHN